MASKNALVAGKNATAYSTAKAAEAHLACCLAEEGGQWNIRVNTVAPDAVLAGSRIWDSVWREKRAATYGVAPGQLEAAYLRRTTLGVNILPEDVAEAVAFFVSPTRASKSEISSTSGEWLRPIRAKGEKHMVAQGGSDQPWGCQRAGATGPRRSNAYTRRGASLCQSTCHDPRTLLLEPALALEGGAGRAAQSAPPGRLAG